MKLALTGTRIFDGFRFHQQSALLIDGSKIVGIVEQDAIPGDFTQKPLGRGILAPGFIDLQINGAGGAQFNNSPTQEAIETMVNAIARFGVTRILPTVITDDPEVTRQAIQAAKACVGEDSGALGIHVEGPFFNLKKAGVHLPEKIRKISDQDWQWLEQLQDMPSILTLAPEQVDATDIQRIADLGVRICAGHTNAKYADVLRAQQNGLTGFTHLYNAMRPITGREPGVVGAALASRETWAGIIADGIHVHPESVRIAIHAKGFEKVFLVSDAMATVGSSNKKFELYGEEIEEFDGRLVNAEGRLAGSAISLEDAIQYCVHTMNIPLEQALAMASRIPAEYMLQGDRLGQFNNGYLADICWLDDQLDVLSVWRAGKQIHSISEN